MIGPIRRLALCALAWATADGTLVENALGSPQDLGSASGIAVCANRSSFCSVLLDVPTGCGGGGCPVLFCLHGFGGSNEKYVQYCGAAIRASTAPFIGVYPHGEPLAKGQDGQAEGFGWNDGMAVNNATTTLLCAYDNFTCKLDPNDGVFFAGMVRALRVVGVRGTLFAFGQSNGADWVQRLGANAGPALPFAGIAAQSGQMNAQPPRSAVGPYNLNQPPSSSSSSSSSSPRVAQLAIHGTDDATIAYDGGPKFRSPVFIMYSEPNSDKAWAQYNGCNMKNLTVRNVSAVFYNHRVANHSLSGVAAHHAYGACPPDAPVEWYQTYGAGHVGTSALDGAPLMATVTAFFLRVEAAKQAVETRKQKWGAKNGRRSQAAV